MGMMLRRYHAAKKETFDKEEVIEEAKTQYVFDMVDKTFVPDPTVINPEKRKYTKRTDVE